MKQNKKSIFIGLTGGIGSGKTTAAHCFSELGAEVFDADKISRDALELNGPCIGKTVEKFGSGILNEDGSINRKILAEIIFSSEEKRLELNNIIHPYVIHELLRCAYLSSKSLIVFDVPLLYECGLDKQMNCNVAVCAEREKRITRVMERNGFSRNEVIRRISAQATIERRFPEADYVLYNNGTKEELKIQVEDVYKKIMEKFQ